MALKMPRNDDPVVTGLVGLNHTAIGGLLASALAFSAFSAL
jgi:hypothetical protein